MCEYVCGQRQLCQLANNLWHVESVVTATLTSLSCANMCPPIAKTNVTKAM